MALEVLTVSTHPKMKIVSWNRSSMEGVIDSMCDICKIYSDVPGMGNFPCLFKKAAYALMNCCAWMVENQDQFQLRENVALNQGNQRDHHQCQREVIMPWSLDLARAFGVAVLWKQ